MKWLTFEQAGKTLLGSFSKSGKSVLTLPMLGIEDKYRDMPHFIAEVGEAEKQSAFDALNSGKEGIPTEEVKLCAPILRPIHDIMCVGVNYLEHQKEIKQRTAAENDPNRSAIYFSKRACSLTVSGQKVQLQDHVDNSLDYEVELAVIIGKQGKNISEDEALDHIFGYAVFNDFSARVTQRKHVQWFRGKSLDSYSAIGNCIVDKALIPDPQNLTVECYVNGERRQHSHTSLMMTPVAKIIAELSTGMTLEPGDIIATGTPSGVAMGMNPPVYLKKGDVVECRIENVGNLINEIE